MNFLVLGDGPEELAWARTLAEHPEHRLWAAYPGFEAFPDLPGRRDLDEALATDGVEAAVVGGGPELRAEGLRRVAATGLPAICLHPPGPNADPYYQVALSRQETGAIVVPDLPARLHPGIAALRQAIAARELGGVRGLRLEAAVGPGGDDDLTGRVLPRLVDVVRALAGEVETVTATGDPPGERPTESLTVHLRGPEGRRAEIRVEAGPFGSTRLIVSFERGELGLELDPGLTGPARLVRRAVEPPGLDGGAGLRAEHGPASERHELVELGSWDPRAAILRVVSEAVAGRDAHPDLLDGTRTLELADAVRKSLRRGRTVDLHYEEISELGTFKSVMTSAGCVLLFAALFALPVSLVGPALGIAWTVYLAYAIPPLLVLFMLLQVLRFAMRRS